MSTVSPQELIDIFGFSPERAVEIAEGMEALKKLSRIYKIKEAELNVHKGIIEYQETQDYKILARTKAEREIFVRSMSE